MQFGNKKLILVMNFLNYASKKKKYGVKDHIFSVLTKIGLIC